MPGHPTPRDGRPQLGASSAICRHGNGGAGCCYGFAERGFVITQMPLLCLVESDTVYNHSVFNRSALCRVMATAYVSSQVLTCRWTNGYTTRRVYAPHTPHPHANVRSRRACECDPDRQRACPCASHPGSPCSAYHVHICVILASSRSPLDQVPHQKSLLHSIEVTPP